MSISISNQRSLRRFLEEEIKQYGFDAFGITHPEAITLASQRFLNALEAGYHGTMSWLEDTALRRSEPSRLWPEVRSVIMVAMNYGPQSDPRLTLARPTRGAISVYARHRDYHDLIKGRLKQIASRFAARAGADVKVFVDTAPILEKPLAAAAGLGWQGKHTNLVNRRFGSWLFLGAIFTSALLPFDEAEENRCGSCRACLDACPTSAFPQPYKLDARRCISYLTIELKGQIPRPFRRLIGNRIYGCDDCLAACPWNKFAQVAREAKLRARDDLIEPDLAYLLTLTDDGFRRLFSGSPIKRIGRDRFIRNCLIAAGNSHSQSLVTKVRLLLRDDSPLVRGMAVWALARLGPADLYRHEARKISALENDATVLTELGCTT